MRLSEKDREYDSLFDVIFDNIKLRVKDWGRGDLAWYLMAAELDDDISVTSQRMIIGAYMITHDDIEGIKKMIADILAELELSRRYEVENRG